MKPLGTATFEAPKIAPGDRLGAVVPELAPTSLVDADLSNVIVLAHRKRSAEIEAPSVEVNDNLRPVPESALSYRHAPWTILIAGALLFHLAIVLAFLRAPQPLPEVGLEAITVDLEMIGNNQPVGVAVEASEAAEAPKPENEQKPELARNEPEPPVEAERPEPKEVEKPIETPAEEPKLAAAETQPEPDRVSPEAIAALEKPEPPKEQRTPEAREPAQLEANPDTKPDIKPEPKPQPQKKASKKAAPAQTAQAGGIGAGQSAAQRNYFSQVASHLSRHKRFPPEARDAGQRGVATVSFTIDSDGRVGSVTLIRSSGIASLDAESQEMVRRASPFPTPPGSSEMSFTVPVNFDLR